MATLIAKERISVLPKGEPGMVRAPLRIRDWDKFGAGAIFPGDREGDPWSDLVYVQRIVNGQNSVTWYQCIRYCIRTDSDPLPMDFKTEDGQDCFRQAAQMNFLATDILLARNAVIDLLSTNAINMTDGFNTVMGQIRGSASADDFLIWLGGSLTNPMFGITGDGHQYLGGTSGQRIELNPVNKTLEIYNSSGNLVATHSGRNLTVANAAPPATDSQSTSVVLSNQTVNLISSSSTAYEYTSTTTLATLSTPSQGSGVIQLTIPELDIKGYLNGSNNSQGNVQARIYLRIYDSSNQVIEERGIAGYGFAGNNTETKHIAARTLTLQTRGTKVSLVLVASAYHPSGAAGVVEFSASYQSMTSKFVAQWYRCEYGANGWVISYNSKNYAYLIVEGGKLNFAVVSDGKDVIKS